MRATAYLDHNASTALLPEARQAIVDVLTMTGNPSSVHAHGRALKAVLEKARDRVAGAAGAERQQVVFTSSATEAITQAIAAGARELGADRVVVSAGEHAAVLKAAEASGRPVTRIGLDASGYIDVAALAAEMAAANDAGETLLVAMHAVNNETGVVQPLAAIEALVGPTPHYLFADAVQMFGKRPLEFAGRATDMMAVSAHKIGGPAGAGALLMKGHCDTIRLIPGGGQEVSRRGGTEAVALIAGFGAAAARFGEVYDREAIAALMEDLAGKLRGSRPDMVIFGGTAERMENVINFAVPGLKANVAMMALDLDGVSVSSGSACSSGKVGRSHVLEAMGVSPELADCALRVSLGWPSTAADVQAFLSAFENLVSKHNRKQGQAA